MEVIPPGVTVAFHRRSPSSRSLIRRASGSPKVTEPLEHWGQKSPSAIYFPKALRRSLLLLLGPPSSQAHSPGYAMTATKSMKPKAESWRKSRNATGRRKETICCQVWLSGRPARKPQAVEIVGKQKHSFHADNLGIRPSRGHLSQTVSAATITEFRKWMSPPAAVIDYGAKSVRNSQYATWVEE